MSRVCFHSPSGQAELWGGERAWLGGLCNDVTMGVLRVRDHDNVRDVLRELLDPSAMPPWPEYHGQADYFETFTRWCNSAELWVRHAEGNTLSYQGKPLDGFSLVLNTAARVGGNALKLAARIHGQCEIHAYCEGIDRWWLADLIDEGLETGVLRRLTQEFPDMAGHPSDWEGVAAFLRNRDDEPVVMSYSVCDQFPNRYQAGWEPPTGTDLRPSWISDETWAPLSDGEREDYHGEARDERWDELGTQEQWRIAMDALRNKGGGLRLDPSDWDSFYFGHGLSAFDLRSKNWQARIEKALNLESVPASV